MKLEVVIFKKLADYDLDVCFESHEDRLGLMGPSGSGKSMVLKCIAGETRTRRKPIPMVELT